MASIDTSSVQWKYKTKQQKQNIKRSGICVFKTIKKNIYFFIQAKSKDTEHFGPGN